MDAHFLAQTAKAETTANIEAVINLLSQLQPDGDAAFFFLSNLHIYFEFFL